MGISLGFLGYLPFHVGFFQDGIYPKMPQQQAIATEDYLGIPVGRYLAGWIPLGPQADNKNYGYWLVTDSVGRSDDPASIDVLYSCFIFSCCLFWDPYASVSEHALAWDALTSMSGSWEPLLREGYQEFMLQNLSDFEKHPAQWKIIAIICSQCICAVSFPLFTATHGVRFFESLVMRHCFAWLMGQVQSLANLFTVTRGRFLRSEGGDVLVGRIPTCWGRQNCSRLHVWCGSASRQCWRFRPMVSGRTAGKTHW